MELTTKERALLVSVAADVAIQSDCSTSIPRVDEITLARKRFAEARELPQLLGERIVLYLEAKVGAGRFPLLWERRRGPCDRGRLEERDKVRQSLAREERIAHDDARRD